MTDADQLKQFQANDKATFEKMAEKYGRDQAVLLSEMANVLNIGHMVPVDHPFAVQLQRIVSNWVTSYSALFEVDTRTVIDDMAEMARARQIRVMIVDEDDENSEHKVVH